MAESSAGGGGRSQRDKARLDKSFEILTCTIKAPPFAYAHLELVTDGPEPRQLDDIQVKSYCTAALRQFLGLTGVAIPLDILKVQDSHCWIRVPHQDLGRFAAAITAWKGTNEDGIHSVLRVKQCSDWLGMLVGNDGQDRVWGT